LNTLPTCPHCSGPFQWARGEVGLKSSAPARPRTHLSVHGTAHPMSAASVRSWPVASCLIHSAVDISHPHQQRNFRSGSSVTSDPVRDVIIRVNGLSAGAVGEAGNPSLSSDRATGTVPSSAVSTSMPLSPGRRLYLPTQNPAKMTGKKPHQNGRKMTSFWGAMAKLGAGVDNELGGSAPHQCR